MNHPANDEQFSDKPTGFEQPRWLPASPFGRFVVFVGISLLLWGVMSGAAYLFAEAMLRVQQS